jgi:hypothetical protein
VFLQSTKSLQELTIAVKISLYPTWNNNATGWIDMDSILWIAESVIEGVHICVVPKFMVADQQLQVLCGCVSLGSINMEFRSLKQAPPTTCRTRTAHGLGTAISFRVWGSEALSKLNVWEFGAS